MIIPRRVRGISNDVYVTLHEISPDYILLVGVYKGLLLARLLGVQLLDSQTSVSVLLAF
jgi:hypothetical protein